MCTRQNFESSLESVTLCRSALKLDPENELAAFRLGFALHLNGEIDEAIKWHQRSSNTEQYRTLGNYNLACAYSIKNEPELAFEYLDNAVDAGFFSVEHMENDADLDNIRKDPRFQKVVERAKRKMTEEGIGESTSCTECEVERNEKE